ncbi:YoaK family protein [Citromicrobium bathyomarinum]|uniref:YoaK family protein n=1 Tax=Citromicrobium bathyomarinum TaxID=72174 RepID=UPI00315AD896
MQRFTPGQRRFAYSVAALAGFVDITGFLHLDGYFVSFMTGNTTLLARDLAGGMHRVAVPALLIAGFVIGVMVGTLAGDRWPARRKVVVTGMVAAALLGAGLARIADLDALSLALLVTAMGALNTAMSGNRESPVGLTYMTGALVRTGQLLADRIAGNRSANPLTFAGLWASLLIGALGGAIVGMQWGTASLWVAASGALVLCIAATRFAAR